MHYLHAILVNVIEASGHIPQPEEYEDAKLEARGVAMSETEEYYGSVFDWRTEDNAGRWSDLYPGIGVVLGAEDRERFLAEFHRWRNMPLKKALELYATFSLDQTGWRTQEEIDEFNERARQEGTPEFVINSDVEPLIFDEPDEPQRYYSGIPKSDAVINRDFICQVWGNEDVNYNLYLLKSIMQLICGDYRSDSQFYSLLDYSSRVSKKTLEDVLAHPEKYALVFSDYHN
ncbi:hypothetical protein Tfer_3272 [Thermincola ferriacetica]|uniref:Uncharacterized protein n=1 Tax=Thermincola ferriacetica TaxID=281456 RepID=A0A0L6VY60_9FIRM|nr:hypothetical protein [Thermincola ferriacetica]KNZ68190.1 hypothetical protein Tfer_3272 [Thermincola ferriacetica]